MLQNAKVADFTVSELLRENQLGGKLSSRNRLGLRFFSYFLCFISFICDDLHDVKVNEPQYKRCGVTPHFPKTKK